MFIEVAPGRDEVTGWGRRRIEVREEERERERVRERDEKEESNIIGYKFAKILQRVKNWERERERESVCVYV